MKAASGGGRGCAGVDSRVVTLLEGRVGGSVCANENTVESGDGCRTRTAAPLRAIGRVAADQKKLNLWATLSFAAILFARALRTLLCALVLLSPFARKLALSFQHARCRSRRFRCRRRFPLDRVGSVAQRDPRLRCHLPDPGLAVVPVSRRTLPSAPRERSQPSN